MSTSQQIVGHAEYVKGAVVEEVGSLAGSKEWAKSGASQKEAAIQDMRSAATSTDSIQHGSTLGAVEKKAGELLGCEGMEKEGSVRGTTDLGAATSPQPASVDPSMTATTASAAAFDSAKVV